MSRADFDLNQFLKNVRPYLVAFAYRLCGCESDAEDMVQNVLVETFLEFSQNGGSTPTRDSMLKLACTQVRGEIGKRKPWKAQDFQLVRPILTTEEFWKSIEGECTQAAPEIPHQESFDIGFLTLLQRLGFEERLVFVTAKVLGWAEARIVECSGLSAAEVSQGLSRASQFMKANYFAKDSGRMLWRTDHSLPVNIESFVKILNLGNKEAFKKSVDRDFHCLLVPAPILEQDIFFNDFLTQAPHCRPLHMDVNGLPAVVFEDEHEVQALAVMIPSPQGVATLLGYDVETLSPKLRQVAEEGRLH